MDEPNLHHSPVVVKAGNSTEKDVTTSRLSPRRPLSTYASTIASTASTNTSVDTSIDTRMDINSRPLTGRYQVEFDSESNLHTSESYIARDLQLARSVSAMAPPPAVNRATKPKYRPTSVNETFSTNQRMNVHPMTGGKTVDALQRTMKQPMEHRETTETHKLTSEDDTLRWYYGGNESNTTELGSNSQVAEANLLKVSVNTVESKEESYALDRRRIDTTDERASNQAELINDRKESTDEALVRETRSGESNVVNDRHHRLAMVEDTNHVQLGMDSADMLFYLNNTAPSLESNRKKFVGDDNIPASEVVRLETDNDHSTVETEIDSPLSYGMLSTSRAATSDGCTDTMATAFVKRSDPDSIQPTVAIEYTPAEVHTAVSADLQSVSINSTAVGVVPQSETTDHGDIEDQSAPLRSTGTHQTLEDLCDVKSTDDAVDQLVDNEGNSVPYATEMESVTADFAPPRKAIEQEVGGMASGVSWEHLTQIHSAGGMHSYNKDELQTIENPAVEVGEGIAVADSLDLADTGTRREDESFDSVPDVQAGVTTPDKVDELSDGSSMETAEDLARNVSEHIIVSRPILGDHRLSGTDTPSIEKCVRDTRTTDLTHNREKPVYAETNDTEDPDRPLRGLDADPSAYVPIGNSEYETRFDVPAGAHSVVENPDSFDDALSKVARKHMHDLGVLRSLIDNPDERDSLVVQEDGEAKRRELQRLREAQTEREQSALGVTIQAMLLEYEIALMRTYTIMRQRANKSFVEVRVSDNEDEGRRAMGMYKPAENNTGFPNNLHNRPAVETTAPLESSAAEKLSTSDGVEELVSVDSLQGDGTRASSISPAKCIPIDDQGNLNDRPAEEMLGEDAVATVSADLKNYRDTTDVGSVSNMDMEDNSCPQVIEQDRTLADGMEPEANTEHITPAPDEPNWVVGRTHVTLADENVVANNNNITDGQEVVEEVASDLSTRSTSTSLVGETGQNGECGQSLYAFSTPCASVAGGSRDVIALRDPVNSETTGNPLNSNERQKTQLGQDSTEMNVEAQGVESTESGQLGVLGNGSPTIPDNNPSVDDIDSSNTNTGSELRSLVQDDSFVKCTVEDSDGAVASVWAPFTDAHSGTARLEHSNVVAGDEDLETGATEVPNNNPASGRSANNLVKDAQELEPVPDSTFTENSKETSVESESVAHDIEMWTPFSEMKSVSDNTLENMIGTGSNENLDTPELDGAMADGTNVKADIGIVPSTERVRSSENIAALNPTGRSDADVTETADTDDKAELSETTVSDHRPAECANPQGDTECSIERTADDKLTANSDYVEPQLNRPVASTQLIESSDISHIPGDSPGRVRDDINSPENENYDAIMKVEDDEKAISLDTGVSIHSVEVDDELCDKQRRMDMTCEAALANLCTSSAPNSALINTKATSQLSTDFGQNSNTPVVGTQTSDACDKPSRVLPQKQYVPVAEVAKVLAARFRTTCAAYAPALEASEKGPGTDSANWPTTYHALVHSPSGTKLLEVEENFDHVIHRLRMRRKKEMLRQRAVHKTERDSLYKNLGDLLNDAILQEQETSQREEAQLLRMRWQSKLESMMDTQRRQLREWVAKGDYTTSALPEGTADANLTADSDRKSVKSRTGSSQLPEMKEMQQESFSIQLGAQRKTSHLLRLLCSDMHVLLSREGPELRLLTAMSLYSDTFNAVVLLVDVDAPYRDSEGQAFVKLCERRTELHFLSFRRQLAKVREHSKAMLPGDFYITRHSNLNNVSVVYHLMVNSEVTSKTMNARSPILNGLRKLMLNAYQHNVASLMVPLLFLSTYTPSQWGEGVNVDRWCYTRAELVLKAVKGYMKECASYTTNNHSSTMQFLLPGACAERFDAFASQLDAAFRMVNPVNLQTKSIKT